MKIEKKKKKSMQNAKYIQQFFKKAFNSLQRGDIDVSPSHTELQLFLQIFECMTHFGY